MVEVLGCIGHDGCLAAVFDIADRTEAVHILAMVEEADFGEDIDAAGAEGNFVEPVRCNLEVVSILVEDNLADVDGLVEDKADDKKAQTADIVEEEEAHLEAAHTAAVADTLVVVDMMTVESSVAAAGSAAEVGNLAVFADAAEGSTADCNVAAADIGPADNYEEEGRQAAQSSFDDTALNLRSCLVHVFCVKMSVD